jgi:hypothetical protein
MEIMPCRSPQPVYADDNGRNGVRSEASPCIYLENGSASGNNGYGALVSNPGIAGKQW